MKSGLLDISAVGQDIPCNFCSYLKCIQDTWQANQLPYVAHSPGRHTVCDGLRPGLSTPAVGRKREEKQLVFLWLWHYLGSVVKHSKVNERERWCRCWLDRKSAAWIGNKKETWEQRWLVCVCRWVIHLNLCRNVWWDGPKFHKAAPLITPLITFCE